MTHKGLMGGSLKIRRGGSDGSCTAFILRGVGVNLVVQVPAKLDNVFGRWEGQASQQLELFLTISLPNQILKNLLEHWISV
jgi:hypothetical protein